MANLGVLFLLFAVMLLNVATLPISVIADETTTASFASKNIKVHTRDDLISDNGLCGGGSGRTCLKSLFGDSCSEWGFCGSYYEAEYAGPGCQDDYGVCNPDLATSAADMPTTSMPSSSTTQLAAAHNTEHTGIVIMPVTTTVVEQAASPTQTVTGKFGFCGVRGSSC
ncbi:Putative Endochitinase-like superfamily [Septoria linicola]|uniref:Endochitinase-like superfamily n=1 Tax=Septoria linicola TaxID=215465 RepID=A0A9Q9EHI5_9PEZI|nr:putative Endochitinase-like superfamily [Septoria linicola]USW49967.1 Putative Endochitinase-like superfamily [Septoria linicola]